MTSSVTLTGDTFPMGEGKGAAESHRTAGMSRAVHRRAKEQLRWAAHGKATDRRGNGPICEGTATKGTEMPRRSRARTGKVVSCDGTAKRCVAKELRGTDQQRNRMDLDAWQRNCADMKGSGKARNCADSKA